ncbi:MAG TPA: DUF4142 domain-containing protein, partial [Chitinophagaceae bacterium]|nr:DUF4142 domain-containing protein [Chitinophagaceae bacterium]
MKNTTLFFAAGLVLTMAACNNSTDSKKEAEKQNDSTFGNKGTGTAAGDSADMKKDASFAVAAADGGMLEVQLGQLAQTNGSSAAIKSFGKEMVADHGKANQELAALAQTKGIVLPTSLSAKHQDTYNDLAAKKGVDFDKAYADLMVSDHKEDIDEFQKEADKGNDPDIKAWAGKTLPT